MWLLVTPVLNMHQGTGAYIFLRSAPSAVGQFSFSPMSPGEWHIEYQKDQVIFERISDPSAISLHYRTRSNEEFIETELYY